MSAAAATDQARTPAATGVRVEGDEPLRVAVAAATVSGVATMTSAGLLPMAVGVLLAAVVLAAAWAGWWLADPELQGVRVLASLGLIAAGAVVAVALWPAELLLVAGVCLALLAAAQGVRQESVRDLLVSLAPPLAMLLVSVTLGGGRALAVPLVLTQLLILTAASLAVPLRLVALPTVHRMPAPTGVPGVRHAPRALAGAGLALVLGTVLYLVLPSSLSMDARPRSVESLLDAAENGGLASPAGAVGRSSEAYSSGAMDMHSRGDLPDSPLLEVPAASATLWRGAVLETYDGRRWLAALDDVASVSGSAEVPWASPPETTGARVGRYDVRPLEPGVQVVHAPGTPVVLEGGGDFAVVAGQVVWTGDGASAPYRVTSVEPSDDPAVLRSAQVSGEDIERWTSLPPTLPQRVRDLSVRLVGSAATPYDAVEAVEEHLRSSYRYNLDSRVPDDGEDAVDAFLFTDREGFCEHFAAAEVVLLRAAGIPARMATGFAAGVADGDRRVFRGRDAHAWVEVHLDGVGWVPSDPTAGAERVAPSAAERLLDELLEALESQRGRLLLAVALVVAVGTVAVAVWLVRRRAGRSAGVAPTSAGQGTALLAAYARLERALEETGSARAPAESLRELAERLPQRAGPALVVVERAAFGRGRVAPGEAHRAIDDLDDVTTALLAERLQPAGGG